MTHALVTRGASASTAAIASGSGAFSCGGSTGTGVGIAIPAPFADTTYGGFSCHVTPPNTHAWHLSCALDYQRIQ